MRAVDTNVLVRLLVRDDPKQLAAAESFVQVGAWISHLVLMEAVWVLDAVYRVKPERIATGIEMLLDHQQLVVQDAEVVKTAVAQFRKHPKLDPAVKTPVLGWRLINRQSPVQQDRPDSEASRAIQ